MTTTNSKFQSWLKRLKTRNLIAWALYWLAVASFAAAGFLVTPVAGLIVLGLAFMYTAWSMTPDGGDDQ